MLTDDARYAALTARDPRFDGVFFVGVSTTGIYCRPICTAKTPGRARCTFFATAAQAERAGFRPCFLCRPEVAPGSPDTPTDAVDALVAAAARRIAEGALNDGSVDALAAELGVTARHLRRATEARLGVSPVELAQTRRLALAKQLLHDTALPLAQIAFAAGYGSVRRFNASFADRMGRPPRDVRRAAGGDLPSCCLRQRCAAQHAGPCRAGLTLRLDYRPPYAWDELLAFLRMRAVPGVEVVGDDRYRRVVRIDGHVGTIEVRRDPARPRLILAVTPSLVPVLMPLVAHVRRMFDLDAHPTAISAVLARDPVLARHVAKRPGLRLPGAIDPFEASVRALLGQQVSVAAATTLAGRFAAKLGTPHVAGDLSTAFPTAAEVARATPAQIASIGLPAARAAALHNFARALAADELRLAGELEPFVAAAVELPGVGPWTAHYLAMRALHLTDAFPAADLGIKKALDAGPRAAEARAEAWRPFRSYAVIHLWTGLGDAHADDEDRRVADRPAAAARGRGRAGRASLSTSARPFGRAARPDESGLAGGTRAPRGGDRARDARPAPDRRAARRVLRG